MAYHQGPWLAGGFFLFLLVTTAGAARAAEVDEGGLKYLVVQNRLHTPTHEFSAWVGTLPMDAFVKGLAFSGAYTLHFNDLLAWEVGQFTYSYHIETRLKDELANLPQPVGATPFEVVRYYITSNFMFKPVYGKLAVLNSSIIHAELFMTAGPGYSWMSGGSMMLIANVGVGLRLYAGEMLSFRFDVRNLLLINADDLRNELWLALGVSLSFK